MRFDTLVSCYHVATSGRTKSSLVEQAQFALEKQTVNTNILMPEFHFLFHRLIFSG